MKIVAVKFKEASSRVYNSDVRYYKTDMNLHLGEEVVVPTTEGLKIAMVYDTNIDASVVVENIVIQRIDSKKYRKYRENRLSAIKRKLDMKVSEVLKYQKYERLAKENEEIAELFIEYKELLDENQIY